MSIENIKPFIDQLIATVKYTYEAVGVPISPKQVAREVLRLNLEFFVLSVNNTGDSPKNPLRLVWDSLKKDD